MAQMKTVVDPFGEVNVYENASGGGRKRIVATILMSPHKEGAQTGIALDGSGSMRKLYGLETGRVLSSVFGGPKKATNEITPVAQKICSYLARNIDADEGTTCIYWAVGPGGSQIEVVGDFTASEAESHTFGPPDDFGTGTQLLPAVKYFVERFRDAPWGFYAFVTDGELHDLEEVIAYSKTLARDIASGRRKPVKLVLIGVGPDVAEYQMQALDDLDTGTNVDLWDHKLAAEMRVLEEIFAEVVDKNARVAETGRILDHKGQVVKDFAGVGVPAWLEFELPADATHFTFEVNGERVQQAVIEGHQAPAASKAVPVAMPVAVPMATPVVAEKVIEELPVDPNEAEWKELPLEFEKDAPKDGPDVGLEKHA